MEDLWPIVYFTVPERQPSEGCPGTVREVEIIIIRKKLISMSIISTFITVPG